MTEYGAYKFIDKELKEEGIELDKDTILSMMYAYEDMLTEIIANCDSFRIRDLLEISRVVKKPYCISRFYQTMLARRPSLFHNYSSAKVGWPKVKFLRDAKYCQLIRADEYYAESPQRYTTKARKFRQDCDLPEIPEYENLPEEEVVKLCQKADAEEIGVITIRKSKYLERQNRVREKVNRLRMQDFIAKDIQEQLDAGIPEDEVVEKTPEEIRKKLGKQYEDWRIENLKTDQIEQRRKRQNAFNPYLKILVPPEKKPTQESKDSE